MNNWLIAFLLLLSHFSLFALGWYTRHYFANWFDYPNEYTVSRESTGIADWMESQRVRREAVSEYIRNVR